MSRERSSMTITTLRYLFFGRCVNSSMIVLDLGVFPRELHFLRKKPRSKTITSEFTQWPQNRWCTVIMVDYVWHVIQENKWTINIWHVYLVLIIFWWNCCWCCYCHLLLMVFFFLYQYFNIINIISNIIINTCYANLLSVQSDIWDPDDIGWQLYTFNVAILSWVPSKKLIFPSL